MINGYEASATTPAAGAAAAYAALRTAAGRRARVREVGAFSSAATVAAATQLIRSATTGTASTSVLGQAQEPADVAAVTNLDTAWSVAPTVSTNVPLRMFDFNSVIGSGAIFSWPSDGELVIPVSASILIWNAGGGAGPALRVYAVWSE